MKTPVIEVKNLSRSFRSIKKGTGFKGALELLVSPKYSEVEAVRGVSFSIDEPGAFVGLIGANGAGKTTLLKMLTGLIPPTSGEVHVLGVKPFTRPMDFRKKISLVMGQKAQLWWDLPARDAFDLNRAIYEIPVPVYKERLNTLAELLDVQKLLGTQIRRLSLGERMKMELIGAILHWPSVIFLDEPTIGLDVIAAERLREFLKQHNQKEKATILLTSHNMDDIEKCCSRVMILQEGKFIYDGTPSALTHTGLKTLRLHFRVDPPLAELEALSGGKAIPKDEEGNVRLSVAEAQVPSVLQAILGKYELLDLGFEEVSLEQVIEKLFAKTGLA